MVCKFINMGMKNLFGALALMFFISGCTLFQSSKFDANEYSSFIRVLTVAERSVAVCEQESINIIMVQITQAIEFELHTLENYSKYRAINNESTVEIVKILRETNSELYTRYSTTTPSKLYCQTKMAILIEQAKAGAEAMQTKVKK